MPERNFRGNRVPGRTASFGQATVMRSLRQRTEDVVVTETKGDTPPLNKGGLPVDLLWSRIFQPSNLV